MESIEPEVIDIHLGDTPVISLDSTTEKNVSVNDKPSVNFGDGIELLMNDKRKSSGTKTPTSEIDITDLSALEADLNLSLIHI